MPVRMADVARRQSCAEVEGRQLEGNRIMLANWREAVHANADGGHVALLGQLGGALGDVFRRALEQVLHHDRRAVARARRPAGRISALAFPKLGHSPRSSAGFGVCGCAAGGGQKTLAFGAPALGPQKTKAFFWGAPPPRNEKPGAVSRPGWTHFSSVLFFT